MPFFVEMASYVVDFSPTRYTIRFQVSNKRIESNTKISVFNFLMNLE